MSAFLSVYWILAASIWYMENGILHDFFVLAKHKGPYNRELLHLLMDGHVLLLSGAISMVAFWAIQHKMQYGAMITLLIGCFMVIYCLMIFPFLKSIVTLLISILLIVVSIRLLQLQL
ncbi:MAG: hypothetical protein WC760_05735 [Bacteroidia bacterium]|jgi:hypothetical protein